MSDPNQAYQEGYAAYYAGKRRSDNKYALNSTAYERWDDGWVDAEICDNESNSDSDDGE